MAVLAIAFVSLNSCDLFHLGHPRPAAGLWTTGDGSVSFNVGLGGLSVTAFGSPLGGGKDSMTYDVAGATIPVLPDIPINILTSDAFNGDYANGCVFQLNDSKGISIIWGEWKPDMSECDGQTIPGRDSQGNATVVGAYSWTAKHQ